MIRFNLLKMFFNSQTLANANIAMEVAPRKMSDGVGVKQSTLIIANNSGRRPSLAPAKNIRDEVNII
jgi:hypothetical protein